MSSPGRPLPILEVAERLGVPRRHLVLYGDDKAKVRLAAREQSGREPGRLILVTAVTPTGAGEGKTTTSIALAQGLAHIGERVAVALREPSLGPIFGRKGGATGGGRAIVVPEADINLHFTGDFHAVSAANNLLAALLDNHLHFGNGLAVDARRVLWRRVIDLNDRALRHAVTGLGGPLQGVPRETGFDITPASEVMAVLCLAHDVGDLGRRLERMLVALDHDRGAITAGDLEAVGAMRALLKDAVHPNLVQTGEGVPAFIHGGPFANIAHGCNSVAATRMAMAYADWTVTEAGFGADLGAEKFFDIKCPSAGLEPAAVVLVATVRALKRHGGVAPRALATPDPAAVAAGLCNLEKHVENVRLFGLDPVVTLNRFAADTEEEIEVVRAACRALEARFAVCDGFAEGGAGAAELARTVLEHADGERASFRPLYDWSASVHDKMETLARRVYGAGSVVWTREAERDLEMIRALGYEELPLCVAKTPASLSDNPRLLGRPEGFEATVRGLVLAAGAGFVVALLGEILRMPGLPRKPQAHAVDLVDGEVVGIG